jgi:hypothetical protein
MKLDQDDRLEEGIFSQPRECSAESLAPPEIVGEVANPVLEAIRRLSWRALDRVCCWTVVIRLSVHDPIYGPEPPIPTDKNARPITRGSLGPFQWPVKRSNREKMPCRARVSAARAGGREKDARF